jgi:hypothetical protein
MANAFATGIYNGVSEVIPGVSEERQLTQYYTNPGAKIHSSPPDCAVERGRGTRKGTVDIGTSNSDSI